MEQYIPFMMRLTDFLERTEMTLQQMKAENPECAAVREKLLFVLGERKEMRFGNQPNEQELHSLLDMQDVFNALRKIFVLLKCVENKGLPACSQLNLLMKDCITLIADSIASRSALEKERRRSIN